MKTETFYFLKVGHLKYFITIDNSVHTEAIESRTYIRILEFVNTYQDSVVSSFWWGFEVEHHLRCLRSPQRTLFSLFLFLGFILSIKIEKNQTNFLACIDQAAERGGAITWIGGFLEEGQVLDRWRGVKPLGNRCGGESRWLSRVLAEAEDLKPALWKGKEKPNHYNLHPWSLAITPLIYLPLNTQNTWRVFWSSHFYPNRQISSFMVPSIY